MLTGTLNALFAATVFFVGGHFLLSSHALRAPLCERLGEQRFRAVYSLLVAAAFVWMVFAYAEAPLYTVWSPPGLLAWVPLLVMPIALFLVVAGVTTQGPTSIGGDKAPDTAVSDQAPGILRITRHPFLWGVLLWALSHLLVRGDAATMILMVGLAILAAAGMVHIDQRREASLGGAWGTFAMTTSAIPFAAILSGRNSPDWAGIGWWRPVAALALYTVLLYLHPLLLGVSPLPK